MENIMLTLKYLIFLVLELSVFVVIGASLVAGLYTERKSNGCIGIEASAGVRG